MLQEKKEAEQVWTIFHWTPSSFAIAISRRPDMSKKKITWKIEIVVFLSFSETSGVRQTRYGCESQSYNMKNKS